MKMTATKTKQWWMAVALGSLMAGSGIFAVPAWSQASASASNDAQTQAELAKALTNGHFKDVHVAVQNGVATLTGTVNLYGYKEEAYQKVHHKDKHLAVRNEIEVVSTSEMSDAQLRDKLAQKIAYDRVGYGTTMFNAVTIGVQNGVVTLGGNVYWPPDMDAAVGDAEYFPGVKDVINNIQVDPVSPMDDQIRMAVARAIYGYPMLNQYAIDPAKPIRITVINGNVTLGGMVDTEADKDVAGIRANQVPNVFKVTNDLQVAHQAEKKKK